MLRRLQFVKIEHIKTRAVEQTQPFTDGQVEFDAAVLFDLGPVGASPAEIGMMQVGLGTSVRDVGRALAVSYSADALLTPFRFR